jgi:type IV secretory pathway TrbL component
MRIKNVQHATQQMKNSSQMFLARAMPLILSLLGKISEEVYLFIWVIIVLSIVIIIF